MKNFIAVVASNNGTVEKYLDFGTLTEAENHVASHGGFAASYPGGGPSYWIADPVAKTLIWDNSRQNEDNLESAKEAFYISANTEWLRRGGLLFNLKIRGSSAEQALTARTMKEVQRGGPNADAIATLHDNLDILKDLIEAAADQAALNSIDVVDEIHW